jgi:DNA modification methylase
MTKKQIKVRCKGSCEFSLDELTILQEGEDYKLKELSKENAEKLERQIVKKGFWFPFFVWHHKKEGIWYYTDGTQRHKVIRMMEESGKYQLPEKYPCIEIEAKDRTEAAEAILAQSASYGEITEAGLRGFLDDHEINLTDIKADLSLSGLDLNQIDMKWQQEDTDFEDEAPAPEPPDDPKTKKGQIYQLRNHRLMCGDSSDPEMLAQLLDGAKIDLVNMDPPYNVKVEPRSNNAIAAGITSFSRREDLQCERSKSERGKKDRERMHHQSLDIAPHPEKAKPTSAKMRAKDRPLKNDFMADEDFDDILLKWFENASNALKPGGSFYIWGGYANLGNYPGPLKQAGLYFSQAIVWDKEHPVLTRKDFMGAFEICFYGWKEGAGHKFYGPHNERDLWHVKKVNPQNMVHLTEKPVELAVRSINLSSLEGENVLDLFGGSGSTLIGCEMTDRNGYIMELDEAYCDVIIQRWEEFTGETAELCTG